MKIDHYTLADLELAKHTFAKFYCDAHDILSISLLEPIYAQLDEAIIAKRIEMALPSDVSLTV